MSDAAIKAALEAGAKKICCPDACKADDEAQNPPPCASCGASSYLQDTAAAIAAFLRALPGWNNPGPHGPPFNAEVLAAAVECAAKGDER